MLNRFSTLPKANIRSSQSLVDLGVVDFALQRQQKNYDTQAANIASTVQKANELDFVGEAANQYKTKLNEDLGSFVNQISKLDLADPNVKAQTNGFIQNLASDPELKKHTLAKQAYDSYQKQIQDLNAKGEFHDSNAYAFEKEWNKYLTTGEFNPALAQASVMKRQEPVQEAKKYFENMKADSSEDTKAISDLAGTSYYENGYEALSKGKLTGRAAEVAYDWLQSPATKQLVNDYNKMIDQGTKLPFKSAQDYALSMLFDTAKSYSYSKSSTNKSSALNRNEERSYTKKKEDEYAGEGYMPAMESSKKVELDGDGRININPALDLMDWLTGSDSRSEDELKLEKTLQTGAKKAGMDVKSYVERINSDPNIKVSYYNTKKSEEMSQRFFNPKSGGGEFFTRKIYSQEYPDGISAKEFMKEKGLSEEEMKGGFTVIGDVHADNPYTPKGFSSMINGEPIVIDDSYSLKDSGQQDIFEMNRAKYNGSGTHTFTRTKGNETYKFTSMYNPKTESVELVGREKVN